MVSLCPRRWESKSALIAHLDACEPGTLVIGLSAEAPRAYYSFSVASSRGQGEIGAISSGLGLDVAAVLIDSGRRVLVGHDTWITWIDVETLVVVTSRRLGGV